MGNVVQDHVLGDVDLEHIGSDRIRTDSSGFSFFDASRQVCTWFENASDGLKNGNPVSEVKVTRSKAFSLSFC